MQKIQEFTFVMKFAPNKTRGHISNGRCYTGCSENEPTKPTMTTKNKKHQIDLDFHREPLLEILKVVIHEPEKFKGKNINKLLHKHDRPDGGLYSRSQLIYAYRNMAGKYGLPPYDNTVLARLRRKPVRTSSGVTPVTVLTKPFPCPGECIFCPSDIRMPKSYLADEPGAQRAGQHGFDPYLQTHSRLQAYHDLGHPTDKIEIIVLGGTWSFYPETYQIWFIKRIFDAMHDFGKGVNRSAEVEAALKAASQFHPDNHHPEETVAGKTMQQTYNQVVQRLYTAEMRRSREVAQELATGTRERTVIDEFATWEELTAVHQENETSPARSVGLVIETRPDHISMEEVLRVRRLGCTKVQIGFQSLNNEVLALNKRGHDVAATRRAAKLLRQAGFKIHAHWMPNLYGSSPEKDIEDYHRLFDDPDFRPDELKLYPCSLIESAELMQVYEAGKWQPYTRDELMTVLLDCFRNTPEYCRLTRVVRDIPGTDIVDGNKATNFRQLVDQALAKTGERSPEIRAREIRHRQVSRDDLRLDEVWYESGIGDEVFLQVITEERDIAGFLRLGLPRREDRAITEELNGAAMIREIHVYGQAVNIGESQDGRAQHAGLGTELIERAVAIAKEHDYQRLAVISAIGTRGYYRKRSFADGTLYQVRAL
jgi:elongator complex protein 3